MKLTLSSLTEHLETTASLDVISTTLTAIGLEVEEIHDAAAALAGFTVAEILEATPHPDADKLRVCKVKSDAGDLQIVCGAPNARAGIKVALAKVGTLIPNGQFTIKQSKIRGVESCGMLCSASELNLGNDSAGIMELPATAKIGQPLAEVLGQSDPVIEIAITPNRGDCLGVYGIARDLAAAGLGTLKPLDEISLKAEGANPIPIRIQTEQCRQFIGIYITGVTNNASPDWLQQKLKAIGLRPISTLVDITNYFTFTYGRPLHVYDADKLSGGITVREGHSGETLTALNDKAYTLKGGECVIADDASCLGLGGIVGGVSSGVSASTRNVLLECAWFEPEAIARTGRLHDVQTDARYRFERGVDKGFMKTGAALAAQMIVALCGGKASAPSITGDMNVQSVPVSVSASAINHIAGTPISPEEQRSILMRLGFVIQQHAASEDFIATAPSWRPDITMLADIAEEILRIYGYDKLAAVSLPKMPHVLPSALTAAQQRERMLRRLLAGRGLQECHHWAFMSDAKAVHFAAPKDELMLQNPISADLNLMRPSLLPHLIDAASRNASRGNASVRLFEIGAAFQGTSPEDQISVAAALRAGEHRAKQWFSAPEVVSWLHAKADAMAILEACGLDTSKVQIEAEAPSYYHSGRSGAIKLGAKITLAYFGELHPFTLQAMDAGLPMAACEVFLGALPAAKSKAATSLMRSDFPSVSRDFAFVINHDAKADTLLRAVRSADKSLIRQVRIFDLYSGKGLAEDEKSLALSVTLQANDRTLKEEEIEAVCRQVITCAEKIGARLRA